VDSPYANINRASFTENYHSDKTQGPIASISSGGAAIVRVHAAFYNPSTPGSSWKQTSSHQHNLLYRLHEHFPVKNGYVCLKPDGPKFPKLNSKEYDKMLLDTQVCYHKDVQVTTGLRSTNGFERVTDPNQVVDQVLVAAINLHQDQIGMINAADPRAEDKCRFILDYAYQSTYISAITNKRTQIYLTLVGGGVFGNKREWIYEAIIHAHKKWCVLGQSSISRVTLVLYNPGDFEQILLDRLTGNKIGFEVEMK